MKSFEQGDEIPLIEHDFFKECGICHMLCPKVNDFTICPSCIGLLATQQMYSQTADKLYAFRDHKVRSRELTKGGRYNMPMTFQEGADKTDQQMTVGGKGALIDSLVTKFLDTHAGYYLPSEIAEDKSINKKPGAVKKSCKRLVEKGKLGAKGSHFYSVSLLKDFQKKK